MLEDLILFQKAYDLFVWLFPIVGKFPKNQRFVLGQQLEMAALRLVEDIMYAQKMNMEKALLDQIQNQLAVIRIYIRLAHDVHLFSLRHYGMGSERINELERIIAGVYASLRSASHI